MKRKLKRTPTLVVAAVAMLLFGIGPRAQAIMAGQAPDSPAARVNPNSDPTYSGVGSVIVNGAPLSGVVIASQFVLTAAHVVSGAPANELQFALNLGSTQWTSAVQSVAIYPTYSFPYDDLAVLKLSQPVPGTVPIYQMYSGNQSPGLTITLVGYGQSGNGDAGPTVGASSTVKRLGTNVVDALQSTVDSSGRTSRFFLYDFDGPTGNGSLGGATTGNSSETVVAVGDSGSPVFVHVGNGVQLFGISNIVAAPTGGTVTYEFGTIGGGMVASDPRFAAWLLTATQGTLGKPPVDVPLPLWASVLGALSLGILLVTQASKSPAAIPRTFAPPSWRKSSQSSRKG
jgi:secreted trypsin-like serine protease